MNDNLKTLAITSLFVVIAALAGFYLGRYTYKTVPHGVEINLMPTALADELGLSGATARATFDRFSGRSLLEVVLPTGRELPPGTFLEGWLVEKSKEPPYQLSTGRVSSLNRGGRYLNFFSTENELREYDEIAVTLEEDQDPRPARVLFSGAIG